MTTSKQELNEHTTRCVDASVTYVYKNLDVICRPSLEDLRALSLPCVMVNSQLLFKM